MNAYVDTAIKVLKQQSPKICFAVGVASGIAATVFACKAARKVDDIIEPAKQELTEIKEAKVTASDEEKKELTAKTVSVCVKAAKDTIILFGPAIGFGALSLASFGAQFKILDERLTVVTAGYNALDTAYRNLRKENAARLGDDVDQEIANSLKIKEVEEVTVDKKGNEKTTKKLVYTSDGNTIGPFARYFNRNVKNAWTESFDYNWKFLAGQEYRWDQYLKDPKHRDANGVCQVLWVDVLRDCGFTDFSEADLNGCFKYDENDPNCDCCVDFRMQKVYVDLPDGTQDVQILIDPNVSSKYEDRRIDEGLSFRRIR